MAFSRHMFKPPLWRGVWVEFSWKEFEGRKNIMSPLLEGFHFPSRAWTRTRRRHVDLSGCLTGWERTWGWDRAAWPAPAHRAAVTSPTAHFPPHVYSFPLGSPWGVGTLLSCVDLVCGSACRCGGGAHRVRTLPIRRGLVGAGQSHQSGICPCDPHSPVKSRWTVLDDINHGSSSNLY